jgi:hypothetical protein
LFGGNEVAVVVAGVADVDFDRRIASGPLRLLDTTACYSTAAAITIAEYTTPGTPTVLAQR